SSRSCSRRCGSVDDVMPKDLVSRFSAIRASSFKRYRADRLASHVPYGENRVKSYTSEVRDTASGSSVTISFDHKRTRERLSHYRYAIRRGSLATGGESESDADTTSRRGSSSVARQHRCPTRFVGARFTF